MNESIEFRGTVHVEKNGEYRSRKYTCKATYHEYLDVIEKLQAKYNYDKIWVTDEHGRVRTPSHLIDRR